MPAEPTACLDVDDDGSVIIVNLEERAERHVRSAFLFDL